MTERLADRLTLVLLVAVCLTLVGRLDDTAMAANNNTMEAYTTRFDDKNDRCTSARADPINVAFIGTHASWQNTQRAVGFEFHDDDAPTKGLKWRTTKIVAGQNLPGGVQCVKNGFIRVEQNAQSSRGSGFRHGGTNAKRHMRFFEQTEPFSKNDAGGLRYLQTVGDAHRDLKDSNCRGPGSAGPLNDRVPLRINGRTGYDDGQYLFRRAFPPEGTPFRGRAIPTSERDRQYTQCAKSSNKYTVGWNGKLYFFTLNAKRFGCQKRNLVSGSVDAWQPLGQCPTNPGREGSF